MRERKRERERERERDSFIQIENSVSVFTLSSVYDNLKLDHETIIYISLFYSMLVVAFIAVVKEERVINTNMAQGVTLAYLICLAGSRNEKSLMNTMQA